MLETLKFIQGAVSRKEEFLPALNHFCIESGKIMGYNGVVALQSPIDIPFACSPRAVPFVKAIETCEDTGQPVEFEMTKTHRLGIKCGSFRAFVDCLPEESKLPDVSPCGEEIDLGGNIFMDALKKLAPFISRDASRPWSRGILIRYTEGYGSSAYATNNIIMIERWLGPQKFPEVNLPEEGIRELLRIGNTPTSIVTDGKSIGFRYLSDRWLRTQLLATEWPNFSSILDVPGGDEPIVPELFEGLESLLPFINELEQVYLRPGYLATAKEDNEGALITVPNLQHAGAFNLKQMLLLKSVAKTIGFSTVADPVEGGRVPFCGDHIRGIIVGMRS